LATRNASFKVDWWLLLPQYACKKKNEGGMT